MNDNHDLIPEPSVHLAPSLEHIANSIFGGVPATEEHRDRFDRMTADFINKASLLEAGSAAIMLHGLHRHLRALEAFEDTLCDPSFIAEYCRQNPKDGWAAYVNMMNALSKKHELSEKIKKQLAGVEVRGGDPSKHLHLHVVADSSQVTIPGQLSEDQQRRRLIGELLDKFRRAHLDKEKLEPPKPPKRNPRVVDPDQLPDDLQLPDEDD